MRPSATTIFCNSFVRLRRAVAFSSTLAAAVFLRCCGKEPTESCAGAKELKQRQCGFGKHCVILTRRACWRRADPFSTVPVMRLLVVPTLTTYRSRSHLRDMLSMQQSPDAKTLASFKTDDLDDRGRDQLGAKRLALTC